MQLQYQSLSDTFLSLCGNWAAFEHHQFAFLFFRGKTESMFICFF